jgi:ketosteroid isomerase-like protein
MRRRQPRILSTAVSIFVMFVTSNIFAQQEENIAAAREVTDVDRTYAQLAREKGMPAASVEYFAREGVAFAPRAVNGKKYWHSRRDFTDQLIWQPIFAVAARAADLAYTTGPWELKKERPVFGHYLSIWSKQTDGTWKMALDVGIENPQPTEPPATLQLLPFDPIAGARPLEEARRSLLKAQRLFLEVAHKDVGVAVLTSGAEEIRVYRDNALPAIGLTAARLLLSSDHGKQIREFGGSKLSTSGDLSYTYGDYSEEKGNIVARGIYVSIWRINLNGDWQLMLDLQKKLPNDDKS